MTQRTMDNLCLQFSFSLTIENTICLKKFLSALSLQAKEQELELQNTWSNNRMSKKQTQAKYGF